MTGHLGGSLQPHIHMQWDPDVVKTQIVRRICPPDSNVIMFVSVVLFIPVLTP